MSTGNKGRLKLSSRVSQFIFILSASSADKQHAVIYEAIYDASNST